MAEFAQEPLEPIFDSKFSDGQREEISKAHRWAYKSILLVVEGFKSARSDSSHWRNYTTFMDRTPGVGIDEAWGKRKDIVEGIFRKMAEVMCRKSIRYHGQDNCTDDLLASTIPGQEGPVNLCGDFFNDHWLRFSYFARADWVRAMAVVHEMSHAVVGGTLDIDKSYSHHEVYLLAQYNPAKAVQNGQNYAFFAMHNNLWAPGPEQPDPGIWEHKRVGGAGPVCANGPAAVVLAEDVLMLAYPEPEPAKASPEANDIGGLLHYKTLDLHEGKEVWSDASRIKAGGQDIRSGSAPALAAARHQVHCAYVDPYRSRLMLVSAGTSHFSSEGPDLSRYYPTWTDMQWSAPIEVVGDVDARFGPALSAFSGGQSSGLHCVYVEKSTQLLKCVALFWGEGFFKLVKLPSGFTPIDFDTPRKAVSAPALVILDGHLKCVYQDEKLGYVTLDYQPATGRPGITDVKPGTWHHDTKLFLQLETKTLALAQWNMKDGPALVAIGRGKGDDRTLHYAVSPPGTDAKEVRYLLGVQTRTCRTSYASALVSYGPVLHSFHQHDGGWIDWMTATAPRT